MPIDDGANGAPCFRLVSYMWVFGLNRFTSQKQHGVVLLVDQLNTLRMDLYTQIDKSSTDVEDNRKTVCTLLERGHGRRDAMVVRLLKKSLALKKAREGFIGRVSTVELQIEALENSDFNRNMLKTMQNTADTMRRMGLDRGLSQADKVISELEDNMQLAGEMNESLSSTITDAYLNDDEMDAELDALMLKTAPTQSGNGVEIMTIPPQVSISVTEPQPTQIIAPQISSSAMVSSAQPAASDIASSLPDRGVNDDVPNADRGRDLEVVAI